MRAKCPPGTDLEIWWADEARIGQKNKITRRWARRGTRPSAPHDQRTMWAYIFGAICLKKGKGAGLVLPYCDTDAMQQHLDEISLAVDNGAHAVLILDQAGWHTTPKLKIPDNITLMFLPPRSPELNPVENIWQYMKGGLWFRRGRLVMVSPVPSTTLAELNFCFGSAVDSADIVSVLSVQQAH
ncbi:IS630 family transposase (plasmid) [Rhizobium sp. L51/94]|nr:IS630 family transposase [Rhizobium sp. L51/94]